MGMALSLNVPQTLGMSAGVDFYLSDTTYSSYAAVKGGFLSQVITGNPNVKGLALSSACRFAALPHSVMIPSIKPPLDAKRYYQEAVGIMLAGKSGQMFANLKQ